MNSIVTEVRILPYNANMIFERKLRNLKWALKAINITWNEEPSFRVHVSVSIIFLGLALYVSISPIEWALLILALSGVLSVELINTAIERIGNMFEKSNDPLIGLIKDLGAASASLIGLGAIVVLGIIFVPRLMELL